MRMSDPAASGPPDDDVIGDGVFRAVHESYDAVYDALPRGETFNRLWRMSAYHGDFPELFAHIGFLTAGEAQRLHEMLHIAPGEVLVDLGCGAGGPGLWMARESGASLIGIDPSAAGLAAAGQRAAGVGLTGRARFQHGTFEQTNLADAAADAVMSIDAFQYAPRDPAKSFMRSEVA
jgi:SAM-dependent methyltransferase